MDIITKICPPHVRLASGEMLKEVPNAQDKVSLHFGTEIPHFLIIRQGVASLILPSDMSLGADDLLVTEHGGSMMILEVMERRKARGDWSKNPFDPAPDWATISFL